MGKNIVIPGADFSTNSMPEQSLVAALVVGLNNQKATMRTSPTQGTILAYKQGMNNTKWGIDTSNDYADKANCALNDIPFGATKITASDTAKAKQISICLFDADYKGLFTPSWSGAGNYTQEIKISDYPTAKYYSLNYQSLPSDADTLSIVFDY